jgi:hypothetical protein
LIADARGGKAIRACATFAMSSFVRKRAASGSTATGSNFTEMPARKAAVFGPRVNAALSATLARADVAIAIAIEAAAKVASSCGASPLPRMRNVANEADETVPHMRAILAFGSFRTN